MAPIGGPTRKSRSQMLGRGHLGEDAGSAGISAALGDLPLNDLETPM